MRWGEGEGVRKRRVEKVVQVALTNILQEMEEAWTLCAVHLNGDLRMVRAYVLPWGEGMKNEKARLDALRRAAPKVRERLAKKVQLRYVPSVEFHTARNMVDAGLPQ